MGKLFQELQRRNVIRVCVAYLAAVWLLLQVADIVVPVFDGSAWVIQALLVCAVVGFPVVVLLAWFYELTPEGVKAASDVEAREPARFTGRKIDFVIIGLLVLVVAFLVARDFAAPESKRTIAVLPFDNQNAGDESAEFFAAGIHDDLIVQLSKLSDLRVTARRSVERFTDSSESIAEIAKALGVAAVLEGGVRVIDGRVRVNVQLIDARTETDLWAETYDRELSTASIFGIQSEVALNIANSLRATLAPGERERLAVIPTQNLPAYEAYLMGRQEMASRTVTSLDAAIAQFQLAIERDARFALAYVGLADAYAMLQDWGHLPTTKALPLIRESATRALELDPQLGEAYVSLAPVYELTGEYSAAETAYRRAIELNPGYATAHSWYGLFLRWRTGRIEEALEQAEQAMTLDPLSPVLRMALGDVLFQAGRFEDALAQYRRSIELDPQFGGSHKALGDLYLHAYGRTVDALESYDRALATAPDPDWMGDIGTTYLLLGDMASAESWTERARRADPENVFVQKHLALLDYYKGNSDAAKEFALKFLDGPPDAFRTYMLLILRNADLRAGRLDDARARYERLFPELAKADPNVNRSNFRAAIDLAVVLRAGGDAERSRQLLERALVTIRNVPRLGLYGYAVADAEIHALQGQTGEALSALRQAIDDGWWVHWKFWTELNPNFDSIRNEPEYRTLIADLEARTAAELALVRASKNRLAAPSR